MPNKVLVRIDNMNDTTKSGLYVDKSYNPGQHAPVKGVFIKSGKLVYTRDAQSKTMPWKVPMEAQEGDQVYFDYMAGLTSLGLDTAVNKATSYIIDGDSTYIIIWYWDLQVRIRNKEVYPLNGWVLIKPTEVKIDTTLDVPITLKNRDSYIWGNVAYKGCMIEEYKYEPWEGDHFDVAVGDGVVLRKNSSLYLNDTIHGTDAIDKMYLVQRNRIMAEWKE